MTQAQSFCLYLNTVLLLVIVIVYLARGNRKQSSAQQMPARPADVYIPVQQNDQIACDRCEGSLKIVNVEEELVPVILAALSASLEVPVSELKVKSIKKL